MFLFAILDVTDDDLLVKSKYIWIKSEICNEISRMELKNTVKSTSVRLGR